MMHAADDTRHRWPAPVPGLRVLPSDARDAAPRASVPDVQVDTDAAIIDLYEREYTGIARLAFLLVGDRHRAEDLAHDAFVRLFEHWDDVEPGKALAWLRATTSNLAMSSHRRARTARKHQETLGRSGDHSAERSAEVIALSRSARPDVIKALQTLSPRQRTAVVLKHWLRMTEGEIAEALGCSLGSTRTHLSRGHDALARKLGGHR